MKLASSVILLLTLAACREERGTPVVPPAVEDQPADRDAWWDGATKRPSGREKILAPRELRALLVRGRENGYQHDSSWWNQREEWAYTRILRVDPEDLEANGGMGRKTLQSLPGFPELWKRMQFADPTGEIMRLLDQYEQWVDEGRPIFLTRDEYETIQLRLRKIKEHLDKTDADPGYAALNRALRRVRGGPLSDFPHIHVQSGPFLIFFTARDLQRVDDEDDAAESARIHQREEFYRRRLQEWVGVYEDVLADLQKLYPELFSKHPLRKQTVFIQYVFLDPSWYAELKERMRREGPDRPFRTGFFNRATGWAFLYEPAGNKDDSADPRPALRETAAYLATKQILRKLARNPKDPTENFLDRSGAFWFKEGWPAYIASRQVKAPLVGAGFNLIPKIMLQEVVERRSHLDRRPLLEFTGEAGYTNYAWLLVRYLHGGKRRAEFTKFLLEQVEGKGRRGLDGFEDSFRIHGTNQWEGLQRAVFSSKD